MWPMCTVNNDWWLLLPLLLGLLCGWWAWARSRGGLNMDLPGAGLVGAATGAAGAALGGAKSLGEAAVGTASGAVGAVADGAKGVAAKVGDTASGAVGFVSDTASGAVAGAAGLAGAAVAGAKSLGGAAADAASGAVSGAAGVAGAAGAALGLTPIGVAAAVGAPDDLLKIKGIGPKLNDVLNGLGITRFDQIANWSAGDVDKVDDHLASFKGRIGQEEWIPQAKLLAAGNTAEWERIYGTAAKVAAGAGAAAMLAIGIPGAVGDPDNLLQLKGVGPKLNTLLTGLGITRFDQIAAWGAGEIDKVDDHLGSFKNRITRDSWVEQAGLLAKGAIAEFEAKFGKLDSENK